MIRLAKTNHYIAWWTGGTDSSVYGGYAENERQFRTMCKEAGYDLDGLKITCIRYDARDEMGRTIEPHVYKD